MGQIGRGFFVACGVCVHESTQGNFHLVAKLHDGIDDVAVVLLQGLFPPPFRSRRSRRLQFGLSPLISVHIIRIDQKHTRVHRKRITGKMNPDNGPVLPQRLCEFIALITVEVTVAQVDVLESAVATENSTEQFQTQLSVVGGVGTVTVTQAVQRQVQ